MKKILLIASLLIATCSLMAQEVDSLPQTDDSQVEQIQKADSVANLSAEALWDRANTAYINEDYVTALEIYNSILDSGLSSHLLFFNIANTHYKSGDIARAILNYRKALKISPTDKDILYNLEVAESHTKDKIEKLPEFFLKGWNSSIQRLFGCTGWSVISLSTLAVMLAMMLLFLLSANLRLRKIGFGVAILSAVISFSSLMYAISERGEMLEQDGAVIMSRSVSIKSSPDNSSTDLFLLHEGTTVKIIRSLGDWYEIVISDGKEGWIESKRVEKI